MHNHFHPAAVTLPLFDETDFETIQALSDDLIWEDHQAYLFSTEEAALTLVNLGLEVSFVLVTIDMLDLHADHTQMDPADPTSWALIADMHSDEAVQYLGDLHAIILTCLARNYFQQYLLASAKHNDSLETCSKASGELLSLLIDKSQYHTHVTVTAKLPNCDHELSCEVSIVDHPSYPTIDPAEIPLLLAMLTLGQGTGGSVILRNISESDNDTVLAWKLADESVIPLNSFNTQQLCCTVPGTHETMPAEPGVTYESSL